MTFNRKDHWKLNKAERVFLAVVLCISAGPAGTAQKSATDKSHTVQYEAQCSQAHTDRAKD